MAATMTVTGPNLLLFSLPLLFSLCRAQSMTTLKMSTIVTTHATDGDDCASSPCRNGARCQDLRFDFNCTCLPGYEGKTCSQDINECASSPCINGGQCADFLNDFLCRCEPGFEGKTCAINRNDCIPNPCQNGGICSDLVNGFFCSCPAGFNGTQCQIDIDDCASKPCYNGGTCVDQRNDFLCQCREWYSGKKCQEVLVNLREGSYPWEGRMVVTNRQGQAGPVCYGGITAPTANVVCGMLYFNNGGVVGQIYALNYDPLGYQGSSQLTGSCLGNETTLADCQNLHATYVAGTTCFSHVGITCRGTGTPVRLAANTTGRAEVFIKTGNVSVWSTICEDGITPLQAATFCNTLSLWSASARVISSLQTPDGTSGPVMQLEDCDRGQPNAALCQFSTSTCAHTKDVGVDCTPAVVDQRLSDGLHPWLGRVDVTTSSGRRSSVCPEGWTQKESDVMCRSLGYKNTVARMTTNYYMANSSIDLTSVSCLGSEANLGLCKGTWKFGTRACLNNPNPPALSVDCSGDYQARLLNGDSPLSGRIQIFHNGAWLNVRNGTLTDVAAKAVCSTLGFSDTTPNILVGTRYGNGTELATALTACSGVDHVAQCSMDAGQRLAVQAGLQCFTCGTNFVSDTGTIFSALYPGSAPRNSDCLYHIAPSNASSRIFKLYFTSLTMEGTDFVEIRDTPLGPTKVLYKSVSYGQTPSYTFSSEVWIRFKTGPTGFGRFLLRWSAVTLSTVTSLVCTPLDMTVMVNVTELSWLYPDTRPEYISLINEACTGTARRDEYGNSWAMTNPHSNCWTQRQISAAFVTYRNALIYKEISSGPIVREHRWRIDLECNFIRKNSVSTYYNLNDVHTNPIQQSSLYESRLTLYNDSSLAHPFDTNPVRVRLGQDLYVKLELAGSWNTSLRVDSCTAAPSPDPAPPATYQLIRDGCPSDQETHIVYQGQHSTLFHFKAFEFYAGFSTVYLRCDVNYCAANDLSLICNRKCNVIGR